MDSPEAESKPEISVAQIVATVSEMADTLEHLRHWIYGTDLGYTVVAYTESNPVTVYKCVLRASRNLRTIVDSLPNRSSTVSRHDREG